MRSSSHPGVAPSKLRRPNKQGLVWILILLISAAGFVATYLLFVEPPPPHKIVIAAGNKNGAYFRFAQEYAERLKRDGLTLEVRETAGSVENLRLLGEDESGVAIAIVQSGVASPEEAQRFYAIGSLYHEPLWVFYRSESRLERLSQLTGKRIGVGPVGSGTHAIAMRLLAANGVVAAESSAKDSRASLVEDDVATAARSLQKGELDAAFFVASFEAEYVQSLLSDRGVRLLSFDQREAYHRRFRFLAPVTVPAGMVNLGQNLPGQDVALVAPTAMLVIRKEFHPALVPLLLTAATRVHGNGDELSDPGEFPSDSYCDLPISEDAKRYYKSGQPMLQQLLPFWLASLIDRAKVMLIPLVMLMMPLFKAAPPLLRWRTRRKIYRWYSDLRTIDQKLVGGLSDAALDLELGRLKGIEHQVAFVDVPLSYMEEFYHLRLHLVMLQERLTALREHHEQIGANAKR